MAYSVYCHTIPSGRRYVGISCDPEKRWNKGKGYSKNYIFDRAIKKYGWDAIKHEILKEGLTLEEAKALEKELIAKWKLTDKRYGLNLSGGGDGILSDDTRNLMSKVRKGNRNSVGRVLSEDTKKEISKSLKEYYSTRPGTFTGKHHSEESKQRLRERVFTDETRQKMRKNHSNVLGANNPSARAVIQMTLDGEKIKEYPYAKAASEENHIDLSSLIKCCRGKKKTCGGYRWEYADVI